MESKEVNSILRRASSCRHCETASIVDSDVLGLPNPAWIGSEYWASRNRIALLIQNPSHVGSREKPGAKPTAAQGNHLDLAPALGHPARIVETLGLDLNTVAIFTVALCATVDSKYPRKMLRDCYKAFTGTLIKLACPNILVAFGGNLRDGFRFQLAELVPPERTFFLPHASRVDGHHLSRLAQSLKQAAQSSGDEVKEK